MYDDIENHMVVDSNFTSTETTYDTCPVCQEELDEILDYCPYCGNFLEDRL